MSTAQPTDNDLIERSLSGDKHAFALLYERYVSRIFNFVWRFLGDAGLAEEVTQNTFLAVYRNLHRYRSGSSAAPWIYRIAQNRARNMYRKMKRAPLTVSIDQENEAEQALKEHLPAQELNPEAVLRTKEFHDEIERVINALPEKYRLVLILHDVEGLDYRQIQEALSVPYKTVARRLGVARGMFARRIAQNRLERGR